MEYEQVIRNSIRHQLGAPYMIYVMDEYWSMLYAWILQVSIEVIEMAMYNVLYKVE